MPHKTEPATANANPNARRVKFLAPFISLYKNTPHSADIAEGPLDTIGKVIACVSALFAKKNDELPMPHIQPLTRPGRITPGYTLGLFFFIMQYIVKYTIAET